MRNDGRDKETYFENFIRGIRLMQWLEMDLDWALSLRVLQLNDYEIEVESEPGRGSSLR